MANPSATLAASFKAFESPTNPVTTELSLETVFRRELRAEFLFAKSPCAAVTAPCMESVAAFRESFKAWFEATCALLAAYVATAVALAAVAAANTTVA